MKFVPTITPLLFYFIVARAFQGCGGNNSNQVIVEFPEPVEDSKAATQTLLIYSIIAGDNATCQDLISGASKPGDDGYQEEDRQSIPNPFTKKVAPLQVEKKDTRVRLFFVEGQDPGNQPILRGCNPGGAHDITVALGMVCPTGKTDCDGSFSNGCESDFTTVTDCGRCGNACTNDHGQTVCSAGECVPTCGPNYMDCDGNPNNGCETDCTGVIPPECQSKLNTLANCGKCGNACTNAHGQTACTSGTCVPTCDQDYFDCDGNPNNGCETTCNGHGTCSGTTSICTCINDYDGTNCNTCKAGSLGTYPNCFLPASSGYCLTSECFSIPPTGQTSCFNDTGVIKPCPTSGQDYYGQDPQYPESRTFTSDGQVVTDSITGLIWQSTFGSSKTWQQAKDYCDGLTYANSSEWRLPNPIELHSILDISKTGSNLANSRINATYFPGTPVDSLFWTSSEDTGTTTNAIAVGFGDYAGDSLRQETKSVDKSTTYYVRCVRAGPIITATGSDGRFIDSGGTYPVITDRITGLMWIKQQIGEVTCLPPSSGSCTKYPCRCDWLGALKSCENSTYAGHLDWRLPNKNELISLLNYSVTNYSNAIALSDFPGLSGDKFWSSSCSPVTGSSGGQNFAWWVNFNGGLVGNDYQSATYLIPCVRTGP